LEARNWMSALSTSGMGTPGALGSANVTPELRELEDMLP
jgi:hypothetical protein